MSTFNVDSTDGPPVVALHGLFGSPADYQAVAEPLKQRLHCPWLQGHGAAGHSQVKTQPEDAFAAEVDRLAAMIAALDRGPAVIAGYSLGGRLALGLLARHRRLCAGLVLLSTRLAPTEPAERAARRHSDAQWAAALQQLDAASFAQRWEAQPVFQCPQTPLQARIEATTGRLRAHDPAALARALVDLSLGSMPDFRPALQGDLPPVEICVGAADRKFVRQAELLQQALHGARCTVVPAVGHRLLHSAPMATLAAIRRCFARCRTP
ncbi:MAG: alpha/beta fold hydrolase [Polyangiales bacterium]